MRRVRQVLLQPGFELFELPLPVTAVKCAGLRVPNTRLVEPGDGGAKFFLLVESIAQVVQGVGVVGLALQGLLVTSCGPCEVALVFEGVTQVVMAGCVTRIALDGVLTSCWSPRTRRATSSRQISIRAWKRT